MKIQHRSTQSHPLFTALLLLLLSSLGGLTWWIWQTKFHPSTGQAPGIETPIQGSQLNPMDPFYPQIAHRSFTS